MSLTLLLLLSCRQPDDAPRAPFDPSSVQPPWCETDEAEVDALYEALTLRQRIGQHLMTAMAGSGDGPSDSTRALLEDHALGGAFLSVVTGIDLEDPFETARLIHALQQVALEATGVPLFLSLDQEGGPNAALNSIDGGTDTVGSMPIGATRDPWVSYEQFDLMGRELAALGFNMDFAPVLDTLQVTRHGNLNTRSFGPDPELNADLGVAACLGLQQNLVLPTLKHFPGDGLVNGNTHSEEVVIEEPREVLDATILRPFVAAIDAGCEGVMTIPAQYTALDGERPAVTSRPITTDLLRGELGFEGLVVTDSLGMKGAGIGLEDGEHKGLEALKAGADVLLYVSISTEDLDELIALVEEALSDGTLSEEEFSTSTRRILRMKQRYCAFEEAAASLEEESVRSRLARPEDAALSASHAEEAVVLVHDRGGVLPLDQERVLYVGPDTLFQDPGSGWLNLVDQTFGDALLAAGGDVFQRVWFLPPDPEHEYAQVAFLAERADVVVLGTLQARFSAEQQQLVEWILQGIDKPIVHVMLGVPFDYAQTGERVDAVVALMGSRSVMVEAGARFLYGQIPAPGTMLYDLESLSWEGADSEPSGGDGSGSCEGVDCSGFGICVETGSSASCICHQNYHPSDDGLDCVPDGA